MPFDPLDQYCATLLQLRRRWGACPGRAKVVWIKTYLLLAFGLCDWVLLGRCSVSSSSLCRWHLQRKACAEAAFRRRAARVLPRRLESPARTGSGGRAGWALTLKKGIRRASLLTFTGGGQTGRFIGTGSGSITCWHGERGDLSELPGRQHRRPVDLHSVEPRGRAEIGLQGFGATRAARRRSRFLGRADILVLSRRERSRRAFPDRERSSACSRSIPSRSTLYAHCHL